MVCRSDHLTMRGVSGVAQGRPVLRQKLYELVAERILDDLSQGVLKPGDPLPAERNLAEQYAVGRSSIREALRTLESRGVIETAGRGTFALARDRKPLHQSLTTLLAMKDTNVAELYEVRRVLEAEMAALAAERRTEEDLARMRSVLGEMDAGLDSADRYIDADLEFHLAMVLAARNRVAAHMMQAIREVTRRVFSSVYHIPGSPQRSMRQHRRIFDAVQAGNAGRARNAMRQHLEAVEAAIEAAVREFEEVQGDGSR